MIQKLDLIEKIESTLSSSPQQADTSVKQPQQQRQKTFISFQFPPPNRQKQNNQTNIVPTFRERIDENVVLNYHSSNMLSPKDQKQQFLSQTQTAYKDQLPQQSSISYNDQSSFIKGDALQFTDQIKDENCQQKYEENIQNNKKQNLMQNLSLAFQNDKPILQGNNQQQSKSILIAEHFIKCLEENPLYNQLNDKVEEFHNGNYESALIGLEKVRLLSKEWLNQQNTNTLQYKEYILVNLQSSVYIAQMYRCRGNNDGAVSLLEESLKKYHFHEPELLGQIYTEIAQNYFSQLKLNKAMDYFVKALNLYEKNCWKAEVALTLTQIARIYAFYDLMDEAKTIARCAQELLKHQQMKDFVKIAETYHTLGEVLYQASEYDDAKECLMTSIELKQQYLGKHSLCQAKTFNLLGILLQFQKDLENAKVNYQKAIDLFRDDKQIAKAQILNNLGLVYTDLCEVEKALECFNESHLIYSEFFADDHPFQKRTNQNKQMLIDLYNLEI